jgi:hypothetical protein
MYEYNQASQQKGCTVTYYNKAVTEIYTKNCPAGYVGKEVTYTIPANKYSSTVSQVAVDRLVENELVMFAQAHANANNDPDACKKIHYNDPMSETFTKEGCPPGSVGTTVTYSVPANKYSSLISPGDANLKAQMEINANGQAYANLPGIASCVIDNQAVWEGTGAEQCQSGNKLVQVKDVNPNSPSFGNMQWANTGADPSCPATPVDIYYHNYSQSGITVEFLNPNTGAVMYSFYLSGSNGLLGTVPEGTYNVRMSDGTGTPHNYSICGLTSGRITGIINNVNVTPSHCNEITID